MTVLVASLASGSDGNALLVRQGRTGLLVDCGLSLRAIEPLLAYAGMRPADLCAILLTHEHGDHTLGAGTLARRYRVPVICNSETRAVLGKRLKRVACEELPIGQRASVAAFDVASFAVSHDAAAPVGYCIRVADVTVGLAIDLGCWTEAIAEHLRRADLLVVEANHIPRMLYEESGYPRDVCARIAGPRGHLDNRQAGELLARIGSDGRPRDVRLAHLSTQANQPARALKSIRGHLRAAGVGQMRVGVLPRRSTPTPKGMPIWSSDRCFQQLDLFDALTPAAPAEQGVAPEEPEEPEELVEVLKERCINL